MNSKDLPSWLSTAPIPVAHASVSNTNYLMKSSKARIRALHKALFKLWKASNAPPCQIKLFFLNRFIRGLLITPNLLMDFL